MNDVLSILHRLAMQGREDGKYIYILIVKLCCLYILDSKGIGIPSPISFHRYDYDHWQSTSLTLQAFRSQAFTWIWTYMGPIWLCHYIRSGLSPWRTAAWRGWWYQHRSGSSSITPSTLGRGELGLEFQFLWRTGTTHPNPPRVDH